ncbi:MAG: cupin domain-containing protein [Actinobacteria bacterium]|nr:cupin domain-containing protein [Actinomycetota bacterium]
MVEFLNWKNVEGTKVREGVVRKVVSGERVMLALNETAPGHSPRPHSHSNEQIICVLEGTIRLLVGEREEIVEKGSVVVVPPNVEHCSTVEGDKPAVILDAFSPIRQEYLPEKG